LIAIWKENNLDLIEIILEKLKNFNPSPSATLVWRLGILQLKSLSFVPLLGANTLSKIIKCRQSLGNFRAVTCESSLSLAYVRRKSQSDSTQIVDLRVLRNASISDISTSGLLQSCLLSEVALVIFYLNINFLLIFNVFLIYLN